MAIDALGDFVKQSLRQCGARLLQYAASASGPMRLSFESDAGHRYGVLVYEFNAFRSDLSSA